MSLRSSMRLTFDSLIGRTFVGKTERASSPSPRRSLAAFGRHARILHSELFAAIDTLETVRKLVDERDEERRLTAED